MKRSALSYAATAVALAGATIVISAQVPQNGNPHIWVDPAIDESRTIWIGDMGVSPEQLAILQTEPRQRTQAAALDIRVANSPWESGVIPYVLAPNFTEIERRRITDQMARWSDAAPITFVARTTQIAYLTITKDQEGSASPCFSQVGQLGAGNSRRLNLGGTCATTDRAPGHELGHAIGLWHEQQRADRDDFVIIDIDNLPLEARGNYSKLNFPLIGPYDFQSVMHYGKNDFALDPSRPTMFPRPGYERYADSIGRDSVPSRTDKDVIGIIYNQELREPGPVVYAERPRNNFQRDDLLLAMDRLHRFYMSRYGLQRPQGLSIDGRPDFLGIAQWIFEIYIPARSAGISPDLSFNYVRAAITQTDEWRQKNRSRSPLNAVPAFNATVRLDRSEYLDVLSRLDRFYAAPEGLQRAQGLSIAGGPDFAGIATWIFDIYLNERLRGISPNAAWTLTENAIRATDEWRSKH
jgi:hypothetical protein